MNYEHLQNFKFSAEDITSDYWILRHQLNTFTVDAEEYYPSCYKVNDAKTCKDFVVSFHAFCSQIICIVYYRLVDLTGVFKNHTDLMLCIIESD